MRISDWSSDVCSSDLWCHDIETGKIEFCILHLPPSHPDHQSPRSSERSQQLLRAAAFEFARSRAGGVDIPEIGFELLIVDAPDRHRRSEEHTSELQSLMRISYAVFCLKKKKKDRTSMKQD